MIFTATSRAQADGFAATLRGIYEPDGYRVEIHDPLFPGDGWRIVVKP